MRSKKPKRQGQAKRMPANERAMLSNTDELNKQRAAYFLGVSRPVFDALVASKKIPCVRWSKRTFRIRVCELRAYEINCTTKTSGEPPTTPEAVRPTPQPAVAGVHHSGVPVVVPSHPTPPAERTSRERSWAFDQRTYNQPPLPPPATVLSARAAVVVGELEPREVLLAVAVAEGLSNRDAAKRVGVSESTMAQWKKGAKFRECVQVLKEEIVARRIEQAASRQAGDVPAPVPPELGPASSDAKGNGSGSQRLRIGLRDVRAGIGSHIRWFGQGWYLRVTDGCQGDQPEGGEQGGETHRHLREGRQRLRRRSPMGQPGFSAVVTLPTPHLPPSHVRPRGHHLNPAPNGGHPWQPMATGSGGGYLAVRASECQ